ncbi:hypothetical protein BHC42_06805 [Snodgrassella alvi]|nr:hypothetical protein BHC50_09810 [Snodgrassella alvi]PIT33714.1 hypothetical protein BHC42_06805 [Snodgrassella alvi]
MINTYTIIKFVCVIRKCRFQYQVNLWISEHNLPCRQIANISVEKISTQAVDAAFIAVVQLYID